MHPQIARGNDLTSDIHAGHAIQQNSIRLTLHDPIDRDAASRQMHQTTRLNLPRCQQFGIGLHGGFYEDSASTDQADLRIRRRGLQLSASKHAQTGAAYGHCVLRDNSVFNGHRSRG